MLLDALVAEVAPAVDAAHASVLQDLRFLGAAHRAVSGRTRTVDDIVLKTVKQELVHLEIYFCI